VKKIAFFDQKNDPNFLDNACFSAREDPSADPLIFL
jgi:hypothetical protein